MFLPLTAPGLGASDQNWALLWKVSREMLEIDDLNTFPLMPAPREDLTPSVRPLTTAEASKWLRLILDKQHADAGAPAPLAYTSHSFKATCLSYLAKMGAGFSDRLALGYHVDQIAMALRYSRDGASRPLRILEDCLSQLREGKFKPDETRSGRFVSAEQAGGVGTSVKSEVVELSSVDEVLSDTDNHKHVEAAISSDSEHVTTSSGSSSSEGEECKHVVMPRLPYRVTLIPQGTEVWRHVRLRTVHLAPEGSRRILSCGRKITDMYKRDSVDIRFDFIKCRQCFTKHEKRQ